jgi:hypothetical protein
MNLPNLLSGKPGGRNNQSQDRNLLPSRTRILPRPTNPNTSFEPSEKGSMGEHGEDLDNLDPSLSSRKSILDDQFDLRDSMETTMKGVGESASQVDSISKDDIPDLFSPSKTLSRTTGEISLDKNTGECADPWKGKEVCWNCINERYEFQREPLLGTGTYSDVFLVQINSLQLLSDF